MKSLILKDLYNIMGTMKSMIFVILLLSVIMINSTGAAGVVFMCTMLGFGRIISTFALDEYSKWDKYALVMPVTRNDVITAKYVALGIFVMATAVIGLIGAVIGSFIMNKFTIGTRDVVEILIFTVLAIYFSMIVGSMLIPLIVKYGSEKSRMYMMIAVFIPLVICFLGFKLFELFGFEHTDMVVIVLLLIVTLVVVIWTLVMYKISCSIYAKKEF